MDSYVYGMLEKGSVVQHLMTGITLCGHEVPDNRLDLWDFSVGRGKWFTGRGICFNCLNVVVGAMSAESSMELVTRLFNRPYLRAVG